VTTPKKLLEDGPVGASLVEPDVGEGPRNRRFIAISITTRPTSLKVHGVPRNTCSL
jgi:hypothetical protein